MDGMSWNNLGEPLPLPGASGKSPLLLLILSQLGVWLDTGKGDGSR